MGIRPRTRSPLLSHSGIPHSQLDVQYIPFRLPPVPPCLHPTPLSHALSPYIPSIEQKWPMQPRFTPSLPHRSGRPRDASFSLPRGKQNPRPSDLSTHSVPWYPTYTPKTPNLLEIFSLHLDLTYIPKTSILLEIFSTYPEAFFLILAL